MKEKIKIKIRKATVKNISSIIAIQKRDGFKHSYYLTSRRLKELFKREEIFFIAFMKNKAVGFSSLYLEIRAELHFLSVIKEYTWKGIGSSLLQRILDEAKRCGKKMIYVYTEAKSPAESFLTKKGFKKVGYFNDRFGKGKHSNILSLSL